MAHISDPELLAAALSGYQKQLADIEEKMAELKRRLGGKAAAPAVGAPGPKKSRLSEEARARIAAAQRKRWAAARKAAGGGKSAGPAKKKAAAAKKKAAATAEEASE